MVLLQPAGSPFPLPAGKTAPLLRKDVAETGSWEIRFQLDAETILISLWVGSLSSGSFDVSVYTATGPDSGEEALIMAFPSLIGPSGELLLRKAAVSLSTVIVRITATGPATFDIRAKGLSSGAASTRIEGAATWTVGQVSVTTVPAEIVPASLVDRSGLVIKNFSTNFLYIAENAAKATSVIGYPLGAGESLAFDLQAGQSIWGAAGAGTIDVRSSQLGEG